MAKILVVEDDPFIARELNTWLTKEKHTVDVSKNGSDGLYRLENFPYDLAIIDWNLPDFDGVEICRRMKRINGDLPLLMLTSRDSVMEKVEGLDAGAFDYLVKPCALSEVSARIRALLRRHSESEQDEAKFEDLLLNLKARTAYYNGQMITLTPGEFDCLLIFVKNESRYLDYRALAHLMGKEEDNGLRDRIKHLIFTLREKLQQSNCQIGIHYKRGEGYIISSAMSESIADE
jgi:two-component system response regulator MprA